MTSERGWVWVPKEYVGLVEWTGYRETSEGFVKSAKVVAMFRDEVYGPRYSYSTDGTWPSNRANSVDEAMTFARWEVDNAS